MDIIGKALDDRLSVLNDTVQRSLKNLEHYLSVRIHSLRDEFLRNKTQGQDMSHSLKRIQQIFRKCCMVLNILSKL